MKRLCRRAAALAVALMVAGGCQDTRPQPRRAPEARESAEPTPPPVPAELLPIEPLAALEIAPAGLGARCADTAAALSALGAEIARHRQELATDPDGRRAPAILGELAAAIGAAAETMPAPDGGEELARTHGELLAAWRDLQRALRELATVLEAGDHASARALEPRIGNGIDNLGVTIERMAALCAL